MHIRPLEGGISVFYSTLGPLDVGFLSQMFWGLVSLVQIPGVRMPDIGTNLLLLIEKP